MSLKTLVAMILIAGLVTLALIKEVDGAVFGIGVAAIAGLGGYELGIFRERKKGG